MENNYLKNLFSKSPLKEEDFKKYKEEVLTSNWVKNLISKLSLTEEIIENNLVILMNYYENCKKHNGKPTISVFLSEYGILEIDPTNSAEVKKKLMLQQFELTSITPLPKDFEDYFLIPSKAKPRKLIKEAGNSIEKFSKDLRVHIDEIFNKNSKKGIFLIDKEFFDAKNILKYLCFQLVHEKKDHTCWIKFDDLFVTLLNSDIENNNYVIEILKQVPYLFVEDIGIGQKPQPFMSKVIDVFKARYENNLATFMSAPIDILNSSVDLLSTPKDKRNQAIDIVESFFKQVISNLCTKYFKKRL
ncbi:hypothetical protein JN00_0138 [Metamycoplasma subdolum]|uniref:Uncharacterized protein n=1 Tax=Metamycoplasma subdolum TaxID=92407 RepID=A0A3M0A6E8_9BACT|nr:hypothetical protein [Metamycoplasma subdolum]RMA79089.1 hypothetical protein JN00_0138 [Metamycoplasma subdolum]WPB50612.1 hypothetical protein R9C05_00410 [Metamycoplasma subdolum]